MTQEAVNSERGGRLGVALRRLTDGGPVFALLILFGLNMVAQMDATGFAILVPNIATAFQLSNSSTPAASS